MTKQQNDFKIELRQLEDDLLLRLSAAEGSFLDDTDLVERLETTKATAAEIEHKVRAAENPGQAQYSAEMEQMTAVSTKHSSLHSKEVRVYSRASYG